MVTSIGIIGAGGWLGRAFARAVVNDDIVPPQLLTLSYRSARPDFLPQVNWTRDNQKLVNASDVVIVSVRPEDFAAIDVTTRGKLVISVMAGITLGAISRHFDSDRVVRALPNAAAEYGESYTPWIASSAVSDIDKAWVKKIFGACGSADELSSETAIDYFTGLTGSGPAFPALLMAAMERDAIRRGIDPGMARRAISTLMIGSGRILEAQENCPEDIVQTFLSYRGTTAAAIDTMREAGFEDVVARGLDAACRKSVSMGTS